MDSSESIIKIAAALLKAQKEMEGAKKGADNPFFRSKYADYGAVLEACKEPLNNNGIVILQPHSAETVGEVNINFVETILLHESGEFISSKTEIKCVDIKDPQKFGAGITYARRFGLQSLIALPAEDDDGNKASGKAKPKANGKPKVTPKVETPKKTFTRPKPVEKVEEKPVDAPTEAW